MNAKGRTWKGAFAVCASVFITSPAAQQQPPVRTGVIAVPVDVRVVDRLGNPIADLTQADFEIYEDGQRQSVSHFARWDLSSASPLKHASNSSAADEPYSRAFLIVLGRGRLEGPNKGLTAVEAFVRSLHTTDRVAMLAYKRATELTTERQPVLRFLRWFRERHHSLDVLHPKFPHDRARVEAQLTEAFKDPSLPSVREIPSPFPADNLSSLHFGIEYLRRIQGEKHLVFLSQEHLGAGSKRMMDGFAQRAADARVTVTVLNSGGTPSALRQPSPLRGGAVTQSARSFRQAFAENDIVRLAEYTGGVVSLYEYHEAPLTRLLRATAAGYSLAYYPTNVDWNGKLRRIEVHVNRPGLTLHYRRGYRAADAPPQELTEQGGSINR